VRRIAFGLVVAALVVADGAAASKGGGGANGFVALKSGVSLGTKWTLSAISSDGRYCVRVSAARSLRAHRCGRFHAPGPGRAPVILEWASDRDGSPPTFVVGAVVETVRHVTIRLSDGTARTLATIQPPPPLHASGISFFVEVKRSSAYPIAFTAYNAAGRVVASWRR
jgi:hypothetical protein